MIKGLTQSQVENLIEFIELHFIDSVREDVDIDNIDYVVDMMDTLVKLRNTRLNMKQEAFSNLIANGKKEA